jgi:structural hemagglutinin/hemolysin toxin protein RtxA
MYLLSFYVPETHLEMVKNALFETGAGHIGNYSHCAWQTMGSGQFMPLDNSHAFVGTKLELETVSEYKVEIICQTHQIKSAVAALKLAHPYETPAYHVILLENY